MCSHLRSGQTCAGCATRSHVRDEFRRSDATRRHELRDVTMIYSDEARRAYVRDGASRCPRFNLQHAAQAPAYAALPDADAVRRAERGMLLGDEGWLVLHSTAALAAQGRPRATGPDDAVTLVSARVALPGMVRADGPARPDELARGAPVTWALPNGRVYVVFSDAQALPVATATLRRRRGAPARSADRLLARHAVTDEEEADDLLDDLLAQ
jgi:hypothetical protein